MSPTAHEVNVTTNKTGYTNSPVAHIVLLIGFLFGIVGFFLSWGVFVNEVGFAAWDRNEFTGSNVGFYGFVSIGLAIIGCVITLLSLFKKIQPKLFLRIVRVVSAFGIVFILFLTVSVRLDPSLIRSKNEFYALFEPLGLTLTLIGFVFSLIASFFAIRNYQKNVS